MIIIMIIWYDHDDGCYLISAGISSLGDKYTSTINNFNITWYMWYKQIEYVTRRKSVMPI